MNHPAPHPTLIASICLCLLAAGTLSAQKTVIVDDSLGGESRSVQNPPDSTAWFTRYASATTLSEDGMSLAVGTSSQQIVTYFTPVDQPIELKVGETISARFTFQTTGLNASTTSCNFRFGLFDSQGVRIAADGGRDSGIDGCFSYYRGYAAFSCLSQNPVDDVFKLFKRSDPEVYNPLNPPALMGSEDMYTRLNPTPCLPQAMQDAASYAAEMRITRTGRESFIVRSTFLGTGLESYTSAALNSPDNYDWDVGWGYSWRGPDDPYASYDTFALRLTNAATTTSQIKLTRFEVSYWDASYWDAFCNGDFQGGSRGEGILWHQLCKGYYSLMLFDADGKPASTPLYDQGPEWQVTHVCDFNGDGVADLLWRNVENGNGAIWFMNGGTVEYGDGFCQVDSTWNVVQAAEFSNTGCGSLLWQNSETGAYAIWLLNGLEVTGGATIYEEGSGWTVAATGDLNGDGQDDLVWKYAENGAHAVWLMNGLEVLSGAPILGSNDGWSVRKVADFDGDGKDDILWIHQATQSIALWIMNGTAVTDAQILYSGGSSPEWSLAGAMDLNGDGRTDLIWANANGGPHVYWLMSGMEVQSLGTFLNVREGWTPSFSGNFRDGDRVGVVWEQLTTGARELWFFDENGEVTDVKLLYEGIAD